MKSNILKDVHWLREVREAAQRANDDLQKEIVRLAREWNERKVWIGELDNRIEKVTEEEARYNDND